MFLIRTTLFKRNGEEQNVGFIICNRHRWPNLKNLSGGLIKFKPRFKYGWFHLKLYQMFQDLSRRLI